MSRKCVGEHVAALIGGDFAHGISGFAEDVVWHVPGDGELAGEHRGREAVLALVARLIASEGRAERPRPATPRAISYRQLAEHDEYLFEWLEVEAAAEGVRMGHPVVSRSVYGRIREVWSCVRLDADLHHSTAFRRRPPCT